MAEITVSLVGSTGSIGTQAIEVVEAAPGRFRVVALAAQRSVERLAKQANALRPELVAIGDPALARELAERVPPGTDVVAGAEGLLAAATAAQVVVNGVVGFAGLPVTLAALETGRRLALANKESLIAGPGVDSDDPACRVLRRLLITASGGPFRGRAEADLAAVSVHEALSHPTWQMGPKITIDSSTLMNKGLAGI